MTWKPRSKLNELDMMLFDDKALSVIRFGIIRWSMKKSGSMELLSPSMSNEEVMDELVATW